MATNATLDNTSSPGRANVLCRSLNYTFKSGGRTTRNQTPRYTRPLSRPSHPHESETPAHTRRQIAGNTIADPTLSPRAPPTGAPRQSTRLPSSPSTRGAAENATNPLPPSFDHSSYQGHHPLTLSPGTAAASSHEGARTPTP